MPKQMIQVAKGFQWDENLTVVLMVILWWFYGDSMVILMLIYREMRFEDVNGMRFHRDEIVCSFSPRISMVI